jgi:uncharacterized protein DUF6174
LSKRRIAAALALALLAGCLHTLTGPSAQDVEAARAAWLSHNVTRYTYVYEASGFLSALSGHQIRLVVLNDTVRSAVDLTTGDSTVANVASFPTIEGLFDGALAAIAVRSLASIAYDATYSYPTRIDLTGPPDAAGTILASNLQLVP